MRSVDFTPKASADDRVDDKWKKRMFFLQIAGRLWRGCADRSRGLGIARGKNATWIRLKPAATRTHLNRIVVFYGIPTEIVQHRPWGAYAVWSVHTALFVSAEDHVDNERKEREFLLQIAGRSWRGGSNRRCVLLAVSGDRCGIGLTGGCNPRMHFDECVIRRGLDVRFRSDFSACMRLGCLLWEDCWGCGCVGRMLFQNLGQTPFLYLFKPSHDRRISLCSILSSPIWALIIHKSIVLVVLNKESLFLPHNPPLSSTP